MRLCSIFKKLVALSSGGARAIDLIFCVVRTDVLIKQKFAWENLSFFN